MQSYANGSVVNISNYDLSDVEISALSKTLMFCPTPPKTELSFIMDDIDEFIRKVKLRIYFMDDEGEHPSTDHEITKTLHSTFKMTGKWVPQSQSFKTAVKNDPKPECHTTVTCLCSESIKRVISHV